MSPATPIRSLAAIAFTDIVGYSALVHKDDANAMRLVKEHFALVREIAGRFNGKVIKTIGDSVHLEFASAQAASAGGIAIQKAHQQRNARVAPEQQFEIRIGLHVGDIERRDGDIYGDGVNIAARLQPLAPVGGIAISDHVRGQLNEELRGRFVSRGMQELRNIAPMEVFVIEADAIAQIPDPAASTEEPAPTRRRTLPVGTLAALAVVVLVVVLAALFWKRDALVTHQAEGKSIAVLPFANLSSDKEQEYFSDGIAEDLLNLLSKIETLQVAARTSSFSFKGQNIGIPEIARRLQVANVLEGSVRKSGNQVRVTARLVRAADGFEIWSQTWDRALDDIFKVQDEIASAVVSELKVKLLGAEPTAKPVDPKVYPLLLQAQALANRGSIEGDTQAIAAFEQVVALAPGESRAWAGLARAHFNRAIGGSNAAEDAAKSKQAANKALGIDPSNAIALGLLGRVALDIEGDLPAAARYLERANQAEPGNLLAINAAGVMLMYLGRPDEALPLLQYRVAHDPANPGAYANLGNLLYSMRQWDATIDAFRTALRLGPDYGQLQSSIALVLALGKRDAAAASKEIEAETDEISRLSALPIVLDALGRSHEADAALQAFINQYGKDHATFVAMVFAARGDADRAFEWLEKAVAGKEPYLVQVRSDPSFHRLHDDPRWVPLLRTFGYAPEQLARIKLEVSLPQQASE